MKGNKINNQREKIGIYHSADLDGRCSGAIMKLVYDDIRLIGMDYGKKFPWELIDGDVDVYMADFSLQPFEEMERLKNIAGNFVWIDHHKSAMEAAEKARFQTDGIRRIGIGAAASTWEYFHPNVPIPFGVKMIAQYDVWDHDHPWCVPIQFALSSSQFNNPNDTFFWSEIIRHDEESSWWDNVVNRGVAIMEWQQTNDKSYCGAYSFKSKIDGHKCVCVNRGGVGSMFFDSVWDEYKYDLMLSFCINKNGLWKVSMFTSRDDIDVSEIAKRYGGGGHKNAAGFLCKSLPFRVPKQREGVLCTN